MKKTIFFSILFMCAAGVLAALILQRPFVQWRNAGGITVKGTASERVKADAAVWTGEIEVFSEVNTPAYYKAKEAFVQKHSEAAWTRDAANAIEIRLGSEAVAAQVGQGQALLLSLGASPACLNVSSAVMRPVYKVENGRQTQQVDCYRFTATFRYVSPDVDAVAALAKKSAELTAQGLAFTANAPEFYYTKLEELKVKLLRQAADNARERAAALLPGGTDKLGEVVSASQGVFQITAPLSTDVSDWGCYDTGSMEKDVRCVVSVTYGTKP